MLGSFPSRGIRPGGRIPIAGGVCAALVLLLGNTAVAASPLVDAAVPGSCVVPGVDGARGGSVPRPDGHWSHADWLVTEPAQQGVRSLANALSAQFGEAGKFTRTLPLERGLIGTAIDYSTQSMVVVVDPAQVNVSVAAQRLATAAAAGVKYRVQAGCASAADLAKAEKVLYDRTWHPAAASASFSYHLDPADSTYHVTIDDQDHALVDALRRKLGRLVTVTSGGVQRLDRLNDGAPHWGGAGLGLYGIAPWCTSGFSVVLSNGSRGSVTAGHCSFAALPGISIYSGSHYFGDSGPRSGFPTFDMVTISGSTYSNGLWVDPCCPSVRSVTTSWELGVGSTTCSSGMVMRAVCGHTVQSTNATLCDDYGCTPGLLLFSRVPPGYCCSAFEGDSGGPLYTRINPGKAAVHGMMVGGKNCSSRGCESGYAEKLYYVTTHLNVSVLTS